MMKFGKALAATLIFMVAVALLYSLGSAFYSAYFVGGQLWRSTPFQLLIQTIPYLLGLVVLIGVPFFIIKSLYTK